MPDRKEIAKVRKVISDSASDAAKKRERLELALYTAKVFNDAGQRLHTAGHVLGTDRVDGASPFQHGSDEAVSISLLLRIGAQLISASAELLVGGRAYAGAALLRQMVEVEYLAWAFDARDDDAARWLRSDKRLREEFFKPAKLREAANGEFRGKDYGFHCELGGHPVPTAWMLLKEDEAISQLLLSDLLGHVGRIWDHLISWAKTHSLHGDTLLPDHTEMVRRFLVWKANDPMTELPPP